MDAPEELREVLRKLVLEDPRGARQRFLAELENDASNLGPFLDRLSSPSDTRLRHLVANAIRTHPRRERVVRHLIRWRESESDEFTRRAIDAALSGVDALLYPGSDKKNDSAIPHIVEAYGYVSQRLKHRVRNALLPARLHVSRLTTELQSHPSAVVQESISRAVDAVNSLARIVEAIEVDPDYFEYKVVTLEDWVKQMNSSYASRYSKVDLTFRGDNIKTVRVVASDYLLETIFWNLWVNAHQEIGDGCVIGLQSLVRARTVEIIITDNGSGFPREMSGVAFADQYSTNGRYRGIGLLEVQDAVARLQGSIELVEHENGVYRIKLTLPRHQS